MAQYILRPCQVGGHYVLKPTEGSDKIEVVDTHTGEIHTGIPVKTKGNRRRGWKIGTDDPLLQAAQACLSGNQKKRLDKFPKSDPPYRKAQS